MEQRQPMLHALIAPAVGDRFIERIVDVDAAEGRGIAGAETADGLGRSAALHWRDGASSACSVPVERCDLRIEAADRFQRVAEEIEPHRMVGARRKDIDDAAAHREVAGIDHRAGAREAVLGEEGDAARRVLTRWPGAAEKARRLAISLARHHALQDGIDRGEQDQRAASAARCSRVSVASRRATISAAGDTRS